MRGTAVALADCCLPWFEVLVVPPGLPGTKPRALNVALPLARGAYLVVYDAEDVPDPRQLRLAAAVLRARRPTSPACRPASSSTTADDSWLTRFFTLEYTALFDVIDARAGAFAPAGPARRHLEPFPHRHPARRPRLGRLERHRGRRSRHPARAGGLSRRRPAVATLEEAPADRARLDEAAHPLDEGLHADLHHASRRPRRRRCASSACSGFWAR